MTIFYSNSHIVYVCITIRLLRLVFFTNYVGDLNLDKEAFS